MALVSGCGSPESGGAELRVGTANMALAVPLVGLGDPAILAADS
jgi:hypothetical protein